MPIDPSYPKHRVEYILADSAVQLLLIQQSLLPLLTISIKTIALGERKSWLNSCSDVSCFAHNINLLSIYYLLYLSWGTISSFQQFQVVVTMRC